MIAGGYDHALVNGTVMCWGGGYHGQLGAGVDVYYSFVPVAVAASWPLAWSSRASRTPTSSEARRAREGGYHGQSDPGSERFVCVDT